MIEILFPILKDLNNLNSKQINSIIKTKFEENSIQMIEKYMNDLTSDINRCIEFINDESFAKEEIRKCIQQEQNEIYIKILPNIVEEYILTNITNLQNKVKVLKDHKIVKDESNKIMSRINPDKILPTEELKIVITAYNMVGKTSVVQRYVNDKYETYLSASLDGFKKEIQINSHKVKMLIIDTPSVCRYKPMMSVFYRRADIIVIMFSVLDRESFDNIKKCLEDIKEENKDAMIFLCGNECDDKAKRKVSYEEGEEMAKSIGFEGNYYEVSAKTGENVNEMFECIVRKYLIYLHNKKPTDSSINEDDKKKKGCMIQ